MTSPMRMVAEPVAWRLMPGEVITREHPGDWPNHTVQRLIVHPDDAAPPQATGEVREAIKRLTVLRDQARHGTPVTDPNEWEADELDAILSAIGAGHGSSIQDAQDE